MNCKNCGSTLNENNQCNNCDLGTVEKMSSMETENFNGITIEDESNLNYKHDQYYSEDSFRTRYQKGPTFKVFRMGSYTNLPAWKKYLYLFSGIAFLVCFIFFALPFLLTVIGIGLIIFIISKFLFH